MSNVKLVVRQIRSEVQNFRRNPTAAIFTLVFPLLFLSFGTFFSHERVTFENHQVRYVDLVIPGVIAYGIFTASFTNLAMRLTILRDLGVLRRVRGTPVPTWIYLAGHIGTSVVISFVMTGLLALGGVLLYSVHMPTHTLLAVFVSIALGAYAFCAMALALSGFIPNGDAAAPYVQLVSLPQFILGGIFFPITGTGLFWDFIRSLPLYHLSHALKVAFNSHTKGFGFVLSDLIVLAVWGTALTIIAIRNFKWENKVGGSRRIVRRRQHDSENESENVESTTIASA